MNNQYKLNKTKAMNKNRFSTRTLLAACFAIAAGMCNLASYACTSLLVGKKASTDGSTFISYAADSHVLYGALAHLPAADHKAGAMRDIRDWDDGTYHGQIPEVPGRCLAKGQRA